MELVALVSAFPRLRVVRKGAAYRHGDGHAVLVLPPWCCGDRYTAPVCAYLSEIGYTAFGWNLGTNWGPTKRLLDGARERLIELSEQHGPVSIVGYSMGGLFARWLAVRMPSRVRQVITVCSPIHEPAQNFWMPVKPLSWLWSGVDIQALIEEIQGRLAVPVTVLLSRDDGLVNYTACIDRAAGLENNIEINGPHVLIASNPQVLAILAERLIR